MKKLITLLFTLALSISTFCQSPQNVNKMSKKEFKELLLAQENEQVQAYIQEYSNRKVTGIGLLIISVLTAFFANGGKKRTYTQDSESYSTPFITASSLAFVIGILLLVNADSSFKKSKDAYLNPLSIQQMERVEAK